MFLTNSDQYTVDSLSQTRKGLENLFEIERVRDRERKIGQSLHEGEKTLIRDREKFEIEGARDRESQLYLPFFFFLSLFPSSVFFIVLHLLSFSRSFMDHLCSLPLSLSFSSSILNYCVNRKSLTRHIQ